MMDKKYLFFIGLLATLLRPSQSIAQLSTTEKQDLLKKIDEALSNVKTVVYKIDYKDKSFHTRDTASTSAVCSLYIAPKDKFNAYNIVDAHVTYGEFSDSNKGTYQRMKYDGKKTLWAGARLDSLDKVRLSIDSEKRTREGAVQSYSRLLITRYFTDKKPFRKFSSVAERIKVREEVLNDSPVFVLVIALEDTDVYRDQVIEQYIRKSDFLPVAHSFFVRFENMEEYSYYEVDYLAINPDISLEAFKIAENETVNARDRYKAFKEMTKTK